MLATAQQATVDVLKTRSSFAVIGVSAQTEKYGREVFETLLSGGYIVYPINPKYSEIDGHPCYPSLASLPAMPDVVVLALPPQVAEQTVPKAAAAGARMIWLPPGCFTEAAVQARQIPASRHCTTSALRVPCVRCAACSSSKATKLRGQT